LDNDHETLHGIPHPENVNEGRDNKKVYMWFCQCFLEPIVGTVKWRANQAKHPLRKFVTPSDEAFAMVAYENNYSKWLNMVINVHESDRKEKGKWTNGGASVANGKNKRFCGWSREGLEQMNKNYIKILKDRKDNQGFDNDLLQYYIKHKKTTRKERREAAATETDLDGFELLNSIPESDQEMEDASETFVVEDSSSGSA
jgi:hypothetical protein